MNRVLLSWLRSVLNHMAAMLLILGLWSSACIAQTVLLNEWVYRAPTVQMQKEVFNIWIGEEWPGNYPFDGVYLFDPGPQFDQGATMPAPGTFVDVSGANAPNFADIATRLADSQDHFFQFEAHNPGGWGAGGYETVHPEWNLSSLGGMLTGRSIEFIRIMLYEFDNSSVPYPYFDESRVLRVQFWGYGEPLDAAWRIDALIGYIDSLASLGYLASNGAGPSFYAKLHQARQHYDNGETGPTCHLLSALMKEVEAQNGRSLDTYTPHTINNRVTLTMLGLNCI